MKRIFWNKLQAINLRGNDLFLAMRLLQCICFKKFPLILRDEVQITNEALEWNWSVEEKKLHI